MSFKYIFVAFTILNIASNIRPELAIRKVNGAKRNFVAIYLKELRSRVYSKGEGNSFREMRRFAWG